MTKFEKPMWIVVKADGTYAGVPCLTEEEARDLAAQHKGAKIYKVIGSVKV